MKKLTKRYFNAFFTLSKTEQRGIIVLSFLIVIVLIANQLLPYLIQSTTVNQEEFVEEIRMFQLEQKKLSDSIFLTKMQDKGELDSAMASKRLNPFPFNPNGLPRESWLALGLSEKQVATIKNYELKGGKFRSKEDVKKMYSISQAEYKILEPFIEIPTTENDEKQSVKPKIKATFKKTEQKFDPYKLTRLNEADSAQIVRNLRFPSWIASRILKYRNLLGGYYTSDQLFEVYGIDSTEVSKRLNYIAVDSTQTRKTNINKADFKQILKHPYISYELTISIVNYREQNGSFKTIDELREHNLVNDSLFTKIQNYLTPR